MTYMTNNAARTRNGRAREELLQDKSFTLHLAFHRRRQNFGGCFLDEIGDIAERDARLGIETERDAGELVHVIDRLQAERFVATWSGRASE